MVLGAGGYRNLDFVKFGGPMQLFMLVVTSIILVSGPRLIPWIPKAPSSAASDSHDCEAHCASALAAVVALHSIAALAHAPQ